MKHTGKTILISFLLCGLMFGCKSTRTATENLASIPDGETIASSDFSSRIKFIIAQPKGQDGYSVNGTLKMQRDSLIQISLHIPVIRSEAARIELTPSDLLVIDRRNKKYALTTTGQARNTCGTGLNFQDLQNAVTTAIIESKNNRRIKKGKPITLNLRIGEQSGIPEVKMELTRPSFGKLQLNPAKPSSRYQEVELEDIIAMLESL